jgi:hypothetical protein
MTEHDGSVQPKDAKLWYWWRCSCGLGAYDFDTYEEANEDLELHLVEAREPVGYPGVR